MQYLEQRNQQNFNDVVAFNYQLYSVIALVADSGEGVCVDPGEKEAILETGGPSPPEKGKGRQLAPDSGREET